MRCTVNLINKIYCLYVCKYSTISSKSNVEKYKPQFVFIIIIRVYYVVCPCVRAYCCCSCIATGRSYIIYLNVAQYIILTIKTYLCIFALLITESSRKIRQFEITLTEVKKQKCT